MLNIGNITTSQFIQNNLSKQIKQISEAGERLSSGKRINSASDDPGVIPTISRLNAKIASISQGLINGGQAITLTQTAESGLAEINNLLSVIRSLTVEGLDSTLTDADRSTLQVKLSI
jgi:Flagellin and related hook-associated proteins